MIAGSPKGPGASPDLNAALADPEPVAEVGRITGHDDHIIEEALLAPGGKRLLTTGQDGRARLWDLASGRELGRLWHPAAVRSAAMLSDGRHAVTGCADGVVRLWDLENGREIRRLVPHTGMVSGVAVSPDGRFALSGGDDRTLRLSDIEKGGEVRRFLGQDSRAWSVALAPDGLRVISSGDDGVVRLGDRTQADPLRGLKGHPGPVWRVAFSPDGHHAASAGQSGVALWNVDTMREVRRSAQDGELGALAFEPDGRRVVYGTFDSRNSVLVTWDPMADAHRRHPAGPPGGSRPHHRTASWRRAP